MSDSETARPGELVSRLTATLAAGLDAKASGKILLTIEEDILIPSGLYLDGGLGVGADPSRLPRIEGVVTRADGRDLSERDRRRVEAWLGTIPQITAFSMGPLTPSDSADLGERSG